MPIVKTTECSHAEQGPDGSLANLVEGAGAGLSFIGAYVPWVVTFAFIATVPVRGVDTPYGRLLTLIPLLVFGLLAWGWYARRARWVHPIIIALGTVTIVLAVAYTVGVKRNLAQAQQSIGRSLGQVLPGTVTVRFDVGLYLAVAGGAAMVIGGFLGMSQDRTSPPQP